MPEWLKEVLKIVPGLVRQFSALFDGSEESGEDPGPVAEQFGLLAATVIPNRHEDDVAEVLISLGEAGELLMAAGRSLKEANPPVDTGGGENG